VREKYCWLVADKPNEQGSKEKKGPMRTNGTGVTLKKRNGSYRPVTKKRTGVTVRSQLALGKLPRNSNTKSSVFS
jgi:hypothetical protein